MVYMIYKKVNLDGCPDDYISFSTKNDYVEWTDKNPYKNILIHTSHKFLQIKM
jgi:hypothetical protein